MKTEPVEFEVNDLTLRGKLFLAEKPKKLAVLFVHGWTGHPNIRAAQKMAENGYTSLTFSLSGHNDSDGKIEDQTRAKSLKEILAAYDLFVSKLPADTKIVVAGGSYGGYMAALLSAERPIAAMQLRVPADYKDENSDQPQLGQGSDNPDITKWRNQVLQPGSTRSLRAVHVFNGPVQILEAERDELVPHQTVQNYVDAVSDKSKLDHHLMKGWPHSLGDDPGRNRQYQEILLNWLNKINEQI